MDAVESLVPGPDGPGYVSIGAAVLRRLIGESALETWDAFAESWNHLEIDTYMADGGRFRRRRYAIFESGEGAFQRAPHGPHYQSREYNRLNGGVERWFEPVTPEIERHPVTVRLLDLCREVFTKAEGGSGRADWRVEMHQFRIEPGDGTPGKPTPEGVHRDGVDWVFVTLIARANVAGGVTAIGDAQRRSLGDFTLAEPLDAVFLDDARVLHAVTPIERIDPAAPGYRDVLVLTFRRI